MERQQKNANMVITETRLNNIANGYLDPDRLDQPFIITRVHNKMVKRKEGSWAYTFIWGSKFNKDDEIDEMIDIEPRIAKKLIDIYGMTVAHQTEDGQVYEMPGTPYRKSFSDKCSKRRRRRAS